MKDNGGYPGVTEGQAEDARAKNIRLRHKLSKAGLKQNGSRKVKSFSLNTK